MAPAPPEVAARDAGGFGPLALKMLHDGLGVAEGGPRYLRGRALLHHAAAGNAPGAQALRNRYAGPALGRKLPELALDALFARVLAAPGG